MKLIYVHGQLEAGGLVLVWPVAVAAVLTCVLVQHELVVLALLADPAARVTLKLRNMVITLGYGAMVVKRRLSIDI